MHICGDMGNLREYILFLVVSVTAVLAVDRTVEVNAVGSDVVQATISKIEDAEIFTSDKRLLRRIAYVETADGESPPSSGNDGGIWNVTFEDFQLTQNNQELASLRQTINNIFNDVFISTINLPNWERSTYEDLNRPLWSALAARLLLIHIAEKSVDIPIASNISGQAKFWKTYYNEAGDVEELINDVEQLERTESKITFTYNMYLPSIICSHSGCPIKSDVIFVLDTSASIGPSDFQEVINFTLYFVGDLNIGPTDNQVGVILFSDVGETIFNLKTFSDNQSLFERIKRIDYRRYKGINTNIADGLCLLLEGFKEENGARLSEGNVFRLAVVMTDGQSNRVSKQCNYSSTEDVAEKVHNFSPPILVFAIGVTDRINDRELQAIATHKEHITYLANFDKRLFMEASDEQTYEFCVKSKWTFTCDNCMAIVDSLILESQTFMREASTSHILHAQCLVIVYKSMSTRALSGIHEEILHNITECIHEKARLTHALTSIYPGGIITR